ncbi:MAG: TonB-dependent receptor [Oligoflexia bacterium]|nr:TonB-dependent receptor [Oligoflexia bacterium]
MKSNLSKMLICALATQLCAANAFADDKAANAKPADEKKLQVVVTASRGAEQSPLDVSQSVASVSQEDLAAAEFVDVDDAIRQIPNVGMAPSEGNPNYWQEGFTIRGLGAQRVLTLSDGVRQAGQGIGYGGGNLSLYDTFGIDRIEVLKGASSVLYGTDAFGGVVNVITRSPKQRKEFGWNAGARYTFDGARDMNRVGAYLDAGDEAWGTVLGGSYTHAQEPNLPDGIDPASGRYRNLGLWGKTDFRFSKDSSLRLLANLDRNSDILVTDSAIVLPIAMFPPPGSSIPVFSPLYFTFPLYQRSMLGAEFKTDNVGGSLEQVKTGIYWQQLRREFHRESAFYPAFSPGFAGPPLFVDPSATVTRSTVDTDDRVNTFEWQTQARWNLQPHVVTLGLDVGYDTSKLPETETQQVVAIAGTGLVDLPSSVVERTRAKADQYRVGLYAQDALSWKNFEFTPGVRADLYGVKDDQSDFDDSEAGLSGSLGTVWHQADQRSIYLNLGTGFRAPDLGERFQDGIVNLGAPSRVIGKSDLDPERSYSAEWGIKQEGSKVDGEMAIFVNHISDYIGTRSLGVVDGFVTDQYDNIGDVNLYGGEIGGRLHVTDRWSAFANAGRTWSKDREKVDLRSWVFSYGTDYEMPVDGFGLTKLSAGLAARTVLDSVDHTKTGGSEKFAAPGFTTVDFKVQAKTVKTALGVGSLVAGVRNIFDRKYKEPFFTLYQPERNIFVGLQFDY